MREIVSRKRIKVGTVGWDDGYAFKVLQILKSKVGKIYVVEVVQMEEFFSGYTGVGLDTGSISKYVRVKGWIEAATENHMRGCDIGHDCEGFVPPKKLFRNYSYVRRHT